MSRPYPYPDDIPDALAELNAFIDYAQLLRPQVAEAHAAASARDWRKARRIYNHLRVELDLRLWRRTTERG